MDALFPGKKRFKMKNEKGEVVHERITKGLDWTAKVVCADCNNTWMSAIENNHAKPAMTDLIRGKVDIPIDESRARSIALFAFKTAVVFDHIQRDQQPFFLRTIRHRFREARAIPPTTVKMWMAGFLPTARGEVHTFYSEGNLTPTNHLRLYVCTYAVGHFVFQVVADRQQGFVPFGPIADYSHIAIPFWPTSDLPRGFVWPPKAILRTVKDFDDFSERWRTINVLQRYVKN